MFMFSQSLKHRSQVAAPSQTAATQQNVRGPLRCLSGLLALLSASEKPQHLDGLPEEVVPTAERLGLRRRWPLYQPQITP